MWGGQNPKDGYYGQPPPSDYANANQEYYQNNGYQNANPGYNHYPPNNGGFYVEGKPPPRPIVKGEKPKWNDLWAGILFLIVSLGAIGASAYTLSQTKGFTRPGRLDGRMLGVLGIILIVAVVVSFTYLLLIRIMTKQIIWITGLLNILLAIASLVYFVIKKYWGPAVVSIIMVVMVIILFISWKKWIKFTTVMLKTSMSVARTTGHVFVVSWVAGILMAAISVWYAFALVSLAVGFTPGGSSMCPANSCGSGKAIGLAVLFTFAMYWMSEWIKNTAHATTSGVYGSWYFRTKEARPTRSSAKRALTFSFGTIALGSLVVAIVKLIRQVFNILQQSFRDNIIADICCSIVGCIFSMFEGFLELISSYAFAYTALYGAPYRKAMKGTWNLFRVRGVDVLAMNFLIGPVLSLGGTFVGLLCMVIGYAATLALRPTFIYSPTTVGGTSDGARTEYIGMMMAFAFLIGLQTCNIVTTPIQSGVEALFVGFANDPQVLVNEHPELLHELEEFYPGLKEKLRTPIQ